MRKYYVHDGHARAEPYILSERTQPIWVIYSYAWVHPGILPEDKELQVSYKLYENNSQVKSSEVSTNLLTQGAIRHSQIKHTLSY